MATKNTTHSQTNEDASLADKLDDLCLTLCGHSSYPEQGIGGVAIEMFGNEAHGVMTAIRSTMRYSTKGELFTVIGWEMKMHPSVEDALHIITLAACAARTKTLRRCYEYDEGVISWDAADAYLTPAWDQLKCRLTRTSNQSLQHSSPTVQS